MMKAKKIQNLLLAFCLMAGMIAQAQNVGINEDNSDPDASAILDLKSTTKGFLAPRMATSDREAISSPAEGLIVFDTNFQALWFFNGTVWQMMDISAVGSSADDVPENPYAGQLYFDTSESKLFIYVSGGWSEITLGTAESNPYGGTGGGMNPSTIVDFFNGTSLLSSSIVNCELEDGTMTTCYQLEFQSTPVSTGPFCPATDSNVGGLGIYNELSVLKASLWTQMESDGYDIVDASGNININDPGSGGGIESGLSYCLEGTADTDITLTFLIPASPVNLSVVNTLESVELVGLSMDGVPENSDPPSAVGGGPGGGVADVALLPSLDPCGGHQDPAGYYHWHFVAEAMNTVLADKSIGDFTCTNIGQSATALVGFAKDGYPIYSSSESDGSTPTGLDECWGHIAATTDYPEGVYHYHASATEAPNLPPCLKGAAVTGNMTMTVNTP
ncbi:MAG: YHYH protein [Cyclobacteriaceae bacterium]